MMLNLIKRASIKQLLRKRKNQLIKNDNGLREVPQVNQMMKMIIQLQNQVLIIKIYQQLQQINKHKSQRKLLNGVVQRLVIHSILQNKNLKSENRNNNLYLHQFHKLSKSQLIKRILCLREAVQIHLQSEHHQLIRIINLQPQLLSKNQLWLRLINFNIKRVRKSWMNTALKAVHTLKINMKMTFFEKIVKFVSILFVVE